LLAKKTLRFACAHLRAKSGKLRLELCRAQSGKLASRSEALRLLCASCGVFRLLACNGLSVTLLLKLP
jgi:hypothetical protein